MSRRTGSLRRGFDLLEVSPGTGKDIRAYPMEAESSPWGPVCLAVDASGHRHVLVPVPAGSRLRSDRRSAGVHTGPQTLVDQSVKRTFLDLVCLRPHLYDVFLRIAMEVVDRINERQAAPDACAIQVLERWRALLSRGQRPGPSNEVLTGIFGELLHLERMVQRDPAAVRLWTGPTGGVWDFTGHGHALEVKTTRSRTGWRARIHGIHQLDPGPDHRLYLSLVRVEIMDGGQGGQDGRSVPAVVEDLVEAGADALMLFERLDQLGLSSSHLSAASHVTFRLLEERTWRVGPDFPRLVRESFADGKLPTGVAAVEYELDLTACNVEHLHEAEQQALYDGVVGGVA